MKSSRVGDNSIFLSITRVAVDDGAGSWPSPPSMARKSADVALMKSSALTRYLVRDGITVNCVAPGGIYIPGTGFEDEMKRDPGGFAAMIDWEYPLGRMGKPEKVAVIVAFIDSEAAALVNGAQMVVDGGQTQSF